MDLRVKSKYLQYVYFSIRVCAFLHLHDTDAYEERAA